MSYFRVRYTAQKWVHVPFQAKRVKRQRTFEAILWPDNKRPDGKPKTRDDIVNELKLVALQWASDGELII